MPEENSQYNLLQKLMSKSRIPWQWATVSVTATLFLLLIIAVCLDGTITNLSKWEFWQNYISGPILIAYILIIYPFVWRLRVRAIQVFRPLLSLDNDAFKRLILTALTANRHWEWVTILLGIALTIAMGQPWDLPWGPGEMWTSVFLVIVSPIFNVLLYWLIYDTLSSTIRIARLSRRPLKLNILETDLLTPIGQWSLGITLFFIGGTSLSLLNQTWESLLRWNNIFTYSLLICVIVLMFFLSMWSAHNAIVAAKKRELELVRKHLIEATREVKELISKDQPQEVERLSGTVSLWTTYQRLVQQTPTWPFNASIIRRFIASIIFPAIVYLIKILAGLGIRF